MKHFLLIFLLIGCSSSPKKENVYPYSWYLNNQEYNKAIEILKPLAEKEGDNQLIYLLELGMTYHLAEKYDESIKTLLKADSIAEVKDYVSLSREASSILLNEGMVQYKGDDYEKVLIHVYLSLNFLMKNDLDGALVESRRVNEILIKYRDEAKKPYTQSSIAYYLSGAVWEADRKFDDAFISYNDTYKLLPGNYLLKKDLLRSAKLSKRDDEYDKLRENFSMQLSSKFDDSLAEVVLIYQQGKGPKKTPDPSFGKIPVLIPVSSKAIQAELIVGESKSKTEIIHNVQDTAIQTLKDQYAGLITKRVTGLVAKGIISSQIGKRNETLGLLSWIGLNVVDSADLRQWSTLPETFQIARLRVKAGSYLVKIHTLNDSGEYLSESKEVNVSLNPKEIKFITFRSLN